jgi:hypothetical protein
MRSGGTTEDDVVEDFEFDPAIDATPIASPGATACYARCTDHAASVSD